MYITLFPITPQSKQPRPSSSSASSSLPHCYTSIFISVPALCLGNPHCCSSVLQGPSGLSFITSSLPFVNTSSCVHLWMCLKIDIIHSLTILLYFHSTYTIKNYLITLRVLNKRRILFFSYLYEMISTKHTAVITSNKYKSNHHAVHLKLIQWGMSIISQ